MGSTIKVDTAVISSSAKKIESYIASYETSYNAVTKLADDIGETWEGEDNQKFRGQMREFEGDFKDLGQKLKDYVSFLTDAVTKYDTAQEQLTIDAGKLASDR